MSSKESLCNGPGDSLKEVLIGMALGTIQVFASIVVIRLGLVGTRLAKYLGVIPLMLLATTSIVAIVREGKDALASASHERGETLTAVLRLDVILPFQVVLSWCSLVEACFSLLFLRRVFAISAVAVKPAFKLRILAAVSIFLFALAGAGSALALNCRTATWFHARTQDNDGFEQDPDEYAHVTNMSFVMLLCGNLIVVLGDIGVEIAALRKGFPDEKDTRDKLGAISQIGHILLACISLVTVVVVLTSGMADYDPKLWGSIATTLGLPICQTVGETYKIAKYGFSPQTLRT